MTAPTIKSWAWTADAYDGPATLPTGIATGDLLVAIHMGLWSGGTPTTSNLPSPTDWTKPTAGFSTATRSYPIAWQVHYQRATSSTPTARTFTVTNPSGGSLYYDTVLIVCISGAVATGDPIEALSASIAANPLTLAGITPAADDRLALLAATNSGGTAPGLPAGFTSITTQADGTSLSWRFASIEDDAAGTGSVSVTSTDIAHAVMVTVQPVPTSAAGTLSGTLPKVAGALIGAQVNPGTMAATLPKTTGNLGDRLPGETGRTTGTTAGGTPWTRVEVTIAGDPAVCYFPSSRTAGTPSSLVIMGHGAGDTADMLIDGSHYGNLATRDHILDQGWICVAPYAGGDTFANPTAQSAYTAAVAWVNALWPVVGLVHYGFSMGAYAGITFSMLGTYSGWPIRGYVGIDMPWDLGWFWTNGSAWVKDLLVAAYGTYQSSYDPAAYPTSAYSGMHALLSWSGDDTTAIAAHGAPAMGSYAGGVANLTLVETNGNHGDSSHFITSTANAWLDQAMSNAAALAGSTPKISGSIAGGSTNPATASGAVPKATGAIAGGSTNLGTLAGSTPTPTASITGQGINAGSLNSAAPRLTATLADQSTNAGTMAATLPIPAAAIGGTATNPGTLAGVIPKLLGAVSDQSVNAGTLAGTLPGVTGAASGTSTNPGTLTSTLPAALGTLTGTSRNPGTAAGTLPTVTGTLTGVSLLQGLLVATLPLLHGTLRDVPENAGTPVKDARLTLTVQPGRLALTTQPGRMEITT